MLVPQQGKPEPPLMRIVLVCEGSEAVEYQVLSYFVYIYRDLRSNSISFSEGNWFHEGEDRRGKEVEGSDPVEFREGKCQITTVIFFVNF